MAKKFLRQDFMRHIKLGKNRKKIQTWRRPKGRHSKMRKLRRGYPDSPTVGYKAPKEKKGKINSLIPRIIFNLNDLKKADKNNIIIIAKKVGARKKIELIKKAEDMKLIILNIAGDKNESK